MHEGNIIKTIKKLLCPKIEIILGGARGSAAIGGFFVNYFLFFGFLRSFSERDFINFQLL